MKYIVRPIFSGIILKLSKFVIMILLLKIIFRNIKSIIFSGIFKLLAEI